MKAMKKLGKPKGPHDHWKSLFRRLDQLPRPRQFKEVQMIVIRPIKPPEPVPGHPGQFYNMKAYVFGKGSERFEILRHRTQCVWDP